MRKEDAADPGALLVGQTVILRGYGGPIQRVVAELGDDVVYVCLQEEYKATMKDGRPPVMVGFSLDAVMEVKK